MMLCGMEVMLNELFLPMQNYDEEVSDPPIPGRRVSISVGVTEGYATALFICLFG